MDSKQRFSSRQHIIPLLGILWGGLLLYWCFQGTPYLATFFSCILDALTTSCILLITYGTGFLLLKAFRLDFDSKLDRVVYCCAAGLGIIAYLVLVIGLIGLLYQHVLYTLLGVLAILTIGFCYKFREQCFTVRQHSLLEDHGLIKSTVLLYSILFLIAVITLCNNLAPVTDYDTMVYHYGLPNIFIQEHRIRYLPENIFSGFPLTAEMLYTLGIMLRGYVVAGLIEYGVSCLFVMAIFSFAKKYFGITAALIASCITASSPIVAGAFSRPASDMLFALFLVLGFFSLATWHNEKKDRWLVTAAVYSGFALGTKYTALFFGMGVLSLIMTAIMISDKKSVRTIFCKWGIFILLSMAVASPWLIKNFIATGNPFFPAFYSFFGGEDYSAAMEARQIVDAHHTPPSSFKDILLLPYQMLTSPIIFGSVTGPFFFLFLPFIFAGDRKKSVVKYSTLFFFSSFIIWLYTFQLTRFMIATIGIAAILSGIALDELRKRKEIYIRYTAVALFAACTTYNIAFLLVQSRIVIDPYPVVFGMVAKSDYLKKHLTVFAPNRLFEFQHLYNNAQLPDEFTGNLYKVIEYANTSLGATDKILFLGETMHAYLKRPYICNSAFNRNILLDLISQGKTDREIIHHLQSLDITHILFNTYELKRLARQGYSYNFTDTDISRLRVFLAQNTVLHFKAGDIVLLQLSRDI